MVERFVGTWQTVASENFDEFLKEIEFQFKLNEPFEGTSGNDKTATIVVTLEGGKLVQKQTCEGRETTIEREIVDGKLIMTCKCGNVVATRTFQK
ncbi:unnamed protein product [Boreogadus saida]